MNFKIAGGAGLIEQCGYKGQSDLEDAAGGHRKSPFIVKLRMQQQGAS